MRRLLLLPLLLLLVCLPAAAGASQWIVTWKPGFTGTDVLRRASGARELHQIPQIRATVVELPAQAAAEVYRRSSGVTSIEPNGSIHAATSDPSYNRQWYLQNDSSTLQYPGTYDADIDAPQAWNITLSNTIRVAVLDSGIDQDHPDLAGRIGAQILFSGSSTLDDRYGHGTAMAGIIAANMNNGVGISGIAPRTSLINVKVLDDYGTGKLDVVSRGIIWAADAGIRIINCSLETSADSPALRNAVSYAYSKGALVIASAGNSGTTSPTYPAAYPYVLGVASTNNKDQLSPFSNRGNWVYLAAPGEAIYSTFPNHSNAAGQLSYGYASGTSQAAALVSGVAALAWYRVPDRNGNGVINDDVRNYLVLLADRPSSLSGINGGRVNACRVVTGWSSC